MNAEELDKRLKDLGFSVKPGTIRRWAAEGYITGPKRYFRPNPQGGSKYLPGRMGDWPETTVEEIAAYLVLNKQYKAQQAKGLKAIKPKPLLPQLRARAREWYNTRFICFGPLSGHGNREQLRQFFEQEHIPCFVPDITFGFLQTWLTTVEKVRNGWPIDKPATVVFTWSLPRTSEGYKLEVTLEEAKQLNLPSEQPAVLLYEAEGATDSFYVNGKAMIADKEWIEASQAGRKRRRAALEEERDRA